MGVAVWSSGVAIKMTVLLLAPAIAVVTVLSLGLIPSIRLGVFALLVQVCFFSQARCEMCAYVADVLKQVLLAIPFLQSNPVGYVSRAFELTRQFLFKWTVNWRFVGEELFLSNGFSLGLLGLHVSLLALFLATNWLKPSGSNLLDFLLNTINGRQRTASLSKTFIMTVMLTSLAVGLLCARSLHYQFFAYLAWATPFLLWRAEFHPVLVCIVWALQEWAWNVFPSTSASSLIVVLSLAAQVFGVLFNGPSAFGGQSPKRSHDSPKVHTQ